MRRQSITQHIRAVKRTAIVHLRFLARRAVDTLGYLFDKLRLRLRHKGDCEREKGHACGEHSEEEESGDDLLDKDGARCRWGEVVLPLAVTCYPTHDGGETGILLGKRE